MTIEALENYFKNANDKETAVGSAAILLALAHGLENEKILFDVHYKIAEVAFFAGAISLMSRLLKEKDKINPLSLILSIEKIKAASKERLEHIENILEAELKVKDDEQVQTP